MSNEKTEEATPKRREKEREKGNIPKSQDLSSICVLISGFVLLYVFGNSIVSHLKDSLYYTFTNFSSSYSGKLRDTDTNYEIDYNQMKILGIRNINKSYWLASRYVDYLNATVGPSSYSFHLRTVLNDEESGRMLIYVPSFGVQSMQSGAGGFRPVFILHSNVKVTGGNGTAESPYTLGV